MLAGLSPEGWWKDLRGRWRVRRHSPVQPAMHQHLRLLQVPVCGWLRSPGAQPQYVQGSVRSAWRSLSDPRFQNSPSVTWLKLLLISAEEPFLIMADHHEIRKLSVDGSNYTILKQVCGIYHHIYGHICAKFQGSGLLMPPRKVWFLNSGVATWRSPQKICLPLHCVMTATQGSTWIWLLIITNGWGRFTVNQPTPLPPNAWWLQRINALNCQYQGFSLPTSHFNRQMLA